MTPKVSIIIPVYNCELYIAQAIESVLNQTYTDYEIIVINDGSTDNTHQVLQPYMKKIRYFSQENKGLSATRNQGIKMAKGKLISLLDADDLFLYYKLQEQVAIFEAEPSIGLVQSGWRVVNEKGEKIEDVKPWHKSPELDLVTWLKWKATNPSGMMFRKEWLERVNGFNEDLRRLEDFDIVIRLALAGCQATWFPKVAVCYRQHRGNMTRNLLAQIEVEEKILDELFSNPNLPGKIQHLEKELRYGSLIWNCWRLYKTGNFSEMATYLQKSLSYTSDPPTVAICTWIELFTKLDSQEGNQFNAYSFSQLPQWKKLISNIFNPVVPRVSVIIATYNNAYYIVEAIASIFNQTYRSYEIIVIDDGSTDNTRQVLEPYLDKIRYLYQENKGVSHARNLGLEMARGEFISFLDADDFFLPDKLAKQVAVFDAHPSLGIVHSGWRLVNEKGEKISDIEFWHWYGSLELDLETWVVWKPVTISMMFRKSWIKSVGGFDTRWHHGEDIDLVLRLSVNGCQAVWLPKITYCYRQHHYNVTRKYTQQAVSINSVLDNFFSRQNLSTSIRQLERKSRYYTHNWLAWQAHRNGDLIEMGKYLRQAWKYTSLSMTETIDDCINSFDGFCQQYGYDFDAYALTNSDVWQQLMLDMVITI
ncbi:MAG: glycosyltransferase [Trichodesmium sp. MAG_R02]|jgi:glycosyltransferase involved in cell wall biosynthesis|nr:glycosyltransferase [Trichodesmium sp. MAG_R02]